MKVKDLLKTADVIKVSPQDTLSSVLAQLESSHDAGFVFDENDRFIGVVNPYYAVIKKAHPGSTKVQSCLIHPPKLQQTDDMSKAARLMIESKIHYLPVINQDHEFVGIVSARRLLSYMLRSNEFAAQLQQKVGDKKIVTIKGEDKLSKAVNLFKDFKISKLVMVNESGAIAGIVSQYDVTDDLTAPKERHNSASRSGNKDAQSDKPVRNFARTHVMTLGDNATYADVATHILEQKIGSIVIINKQRMPIGIVTTKDILAFMVPKDVSKGIEVSLKDVSAPDDKLIKSTTQKLEKKLMQHGIAGGHLVVRGAHKGGVIEVTFSCIDERGYVSVHIEGRDINDIMIELVEKVSSRLDY
ncbi:MAG: inosine 5'-monophosphate dehydrogenase [Microgenomates bacterium OLB23]|nr:MAG: inosine 5'-monophosphate dehydrogenase [Microgenomates bacterium OLB23]